MAIKPSARDFLIIRRSRFLFEREIREGSGTSKNVTCERNLVKVGRRQFNPPCREIHGEVDESRSDVCKGYLVKKKLSVPHHVHVCPFLLWETLRKIYSGRPLLSLAPSEREKNQFVTVGNKGKRFAFEGNVRNMIAQFITSNETKFVIRRIRVITNELLRDEIEFEAKSSDTNEKFYLD